MKKLILLLVAVGLISCGANKKEIIEDPIFPQNKIIFDEHGKANYVVEDPLFPGNFLIYEEPD